MEILLKILILIALTFLPFIELRLSIPVGILAGTVPLFFGLSFTGMNLHPLLVFVIASTTNILLGFGLFDILHYFDKKVHKKERKPRFVELLDRSRAKLEPYIKKYGFGGIALFIALPIPGSGVYVGSIGSYVLGLPRNEFRKACVTGVIIAAAIVTILTLTGETLFRVF